MTLDLDTPAGRCADELDGMIRCVLRDTVTGDGPSPQAWEHVVRRVDHWTTLRQTWWRFHTLLLGVTAWLSADLCPPSPARQPPRRFNGTMWRSDPGWPRFLDCHLTVTRLVC